MTQQFTLSPRARTAHATALAVLADADTNAAVDAVVQLAVSTLGANSGQLSVLTDRLIAVCPTGPLTAGSSSGHEMPFDDTMCSTALRTDDVVVIPDAHEDARVSSLPAVVEGVVRSYLGVPVRAASGAVIAVLCVFGPDPRAWTDWDREAMELLAEQLAAELARRGARAAG